MTAISLNEIEQNFAHFLQRIQTGEPLVIFNENKAIAEIKPLISNSTQLRPFGLCAGEFVVPDDFDDPLPEDILNQFENS
ncbi:Prevent-host-death protein [Beggiatoa sp. PS]|nr:Prevent-host-death protein [Beggiatoa sp. PS]